MKNLNSEYQSKADYTLKSEAFCGQCESVFEHAAWCATREPRVAYAYLIVKDASRITAGDSLILHSLGVAWVELSDDPPHEGKLQAKA